MRIAVLEDDVEQSKVLRIWLEGAGHAVHEFSLSKDFLRHVARESFDLFLIDWMVPDMPGIEALKRVRANLPERVPAILITLRDAEDDVVAGLSAGADDYLVKPPRKFELLARIDAVVRRAQPAMPSIRAACGDARAWRPTAVPRRSGRPCWIWTVCLGRTGSVGSGPGQIASRP